MSRPLPDVMTEAEYNDQYRVAKADAFANIEPHRDHPRAIILAGQPGAGKRSLKDQAAEELRRDGGAVVIDPDALREYHPRYEDLAQEDYNMAASRVQADASNMSDDLRRDAVGERRNIIIDGTLKNPAKAEQLSAELKSSGYTVEVRALAVSERVSRRGVAERLENSLADKSGDDIPRQVPEHVQKEAIDGMPEAVDRLERTGAVDRLSVYRRGSTEPFYVSGGTSGGMARDAILAERNREMTPAEKVDHASKWDRVCEMANTRKAPAVEQKSYELERTDAHVQLRQDPEAAAGYDRSATDGDRARSKGIYYADKARQRDDAARQIGEDGREATQTDGLSHER